ncbi:GNAT family N-acetyltransferase [Bacillus canaveralius]|uniref:GNAT family N-acetyltransferase n=1 Tax=Bacillus canaveralius TaxID=1403243 RepID=UPI000F772C37|nr:GNAT family N-acetyltransferase [Bacillus canaveralius]RSK49724.1 GNAT family N-acetyltransferase [Bacillus canaveralius]
MNHLTKAIQIVEYHEGLAAGIAKMWNMSRDSWGGDTRVTTAAQVIQKEANSGNIALYLAVEGEEVIGYCGLSEYKEDVGSLYIPLLNVCPDYHGNKIGKMLVLRALEKTIELGWPRLDLYTWPGNTKAVPLYKKCGFFWEDRDDVTHLMNFIPGILTTPLLTPWFNGLDWYESSDRLIEVKPDGLKKDGFTLYEYSWKKEAVRVQFEKTGRGMCLIETNDFLLELKLAEHETIEQQPYQYEIHFINKSAEAMTLKVSGAGNERLEYSIDAELLVEEKAVITEMLTVHPGEEPSVWSTHPYISLNVSVNDQHAELRLGVKPKQPAQIKAKYLANLSFLNQKTEILLEVESNLKEAATFIISIPKHDLVELEQHVIEIDLQMDERQTIRVPFTILQYGFFDPVLAVKVVKNDGMVLDFEQKISAAFKGFGEKFGGESKEHWHIFNGPAQLNVRKRDLLVTAGKTEKIKQPFAFFAPKLGKPFSNELSKKKPEEVEWLHDHQSITITLKLLSAEMEGISLTLMMKLYAEGLLEKWVEVENKGSQRHENVALLHSVYHEMKKVYFPLDDKIVVFSERKQIEFGDLNGELLSENWFFSDLYEASFGFAWNEDDKASPEGWQFQVEQSLGALDVQEQITSKPLLLSFGAFHDWKEFRQFARGYKGLEPKEALPEQTLTLPGENVVVPRTESEIDIELKSYRTNYLDGIMELELNGRKADVVSVDAGAEQTSVTRAISISEARPLSIVSGKYTGNAVASELGAILLRHGTPDRITVTEEGEPLRSLVVSNRCIEIKAAREFYPGIYSLSVNGNEWLDTSFPHLQAKGWWNPWGGGMKSVPEQLNTFSLLKEHLAVEHVDISDRCKNQWSGIALTTTVKEHSDWKGVIFTQYYLMLPDVPVLASFVEVMETGGKVLTGEEWNTDLFLGGSPLSEIVCHDNQPGIFKKYQAGIEEQWLQLDSGAFMSQEGKAEKLYVVPGLGSDDTGAYMNKQALQVVSKQKLSSELKTAPMFIVFDERQLTGSVLRQLNRIRFQLD